MKIKKSWFTIEKIRFIARVIKRKYYEKFVIKEYKEKREIILNYKNKFDCTMFVETGTFMGDTVAFFEDKFDKLVSIELQPDLARKAKERFKEIPHIEIYEGDSGKLLPYIVANNDRDTLFWLDGHYSSEFYTGNEYIKTAKGDLNTPIMAELTAILNLKSRKQIILIDDARCFTGKDDYPSIKSLKQFLLQYEIKNITVKNDIIRIIR